MATTTEVAKANGLTSVDQAWKASLHVGVEFAIVCAFLEQESNGANVFGHDPGWYSGAGVVTKAKYDAYKAGRATHNAQGVGPMQLTWPGFQDQADAAGGCWLPTHNIATGLRILKGYIDAGKTWHEAAAAYNGSEQYAVEIDSKIARWRALLAGATTPGGQMPTGYDVIPYYSEKYSDGSPILVTRRILQACQRVVAKLGYTEALTIEQGCKHDGTLSGGTHSQLDVFDLAYFDHDAKAKALIEVGVIPFVRPPNWDGAGGGPHIHCIVRPTAPMLAKSVAGNGPLAPEAAAQVPAWAAHKDGLADGAGYTAGPWGPVPVFVYHAGYKPPVGKQPNPPVKFPLAWTAQHRVGDEIRAKQTSIAALEAVVKAHPNMNAIKTMLATEQVELKTLQGRYAALHNYQG